jgi:DNA polymerase III alpha subunit
MLLIQKYNKIKEKLLKLVEPYPDNYKELLNEELLWIRLYKFEDKIFKDIENNYKTENNDNGLLFPYLLGFTEIDPIAQGIQHSYTSNPDCPDIDCDIDSEHQKMMEEHLCDKYGKDKVAHVATFMEWGAKQVIKDMCNILDISFRASNKLTELILDDDDASLEEEWEYVKNNIESNIEIDEAITILDPYIRDWGSKMQGMIRQIGQHAAGIIITPDECSNMIPVISKKGKVLAGLREGQNNRELTDVGILKGDFLGLATCSIINETLKLIDDPRLDIDKIDLNDKNLMKRFAKGDTECIFQFSSQGMIKLLREIDCDCFDDVNAAQALFRPGPLRAGLDKAYVNNKRNPQDIRFIHEDVKPILGKTYGNPIFQEQQMNMLVALGGFTLAEADAARKTFKTLSKLSKEEAEKQPALINMLSKLRKGCKEKNIPDDDIDNLIEEMKAFAGYSFCAAHSVSYTQAAIQCMYLRNYFAKEFYCALFNTETSSFDPMVAKRLAEADKVKILPPDLTKSIEPLYKIEGENVRSGLYLIKGFSKDMNRLKRLVVRGDWVDFFNNILESSWDKRKVEAAIFSGALDEAFNNRRKLFEIYSEWNKRIRTKYKGMTKTSRSNYENDMKSIGANEIQMKCFELAASRIKMKKDAKNTILGLGKLKEFDNTEECFEHFWKKHKSKFKVKEGNHDQDVIELVEKFSDVEDWSYEEKSAQKTTQLGYDEVDLTMFTNKIVSYLEKYNVDPPMWAGSQEQFNSEETEEFMLTGREVLGSVTSMKEVQIGKTEKKWNQLRIILSTNQGQIFCSITDWTGCEGQIDAVKSFMSEGDIVIVKLTLDKSGFINMDPIKTRFGIANRTPLLANFSKNIYNVPCSQPKLNYAV